jgi:hypothetical protein
MKVLLSESGFNELQYRKWKKDNVTYRGMKNVGQPNNVYGSLGEGLYTVPKSNISMARQYGQVYFVVNGKPKKPKVFNSLNDWEIWFQTNFLKNYDRLSEFEKVTSIRAEMLKLGYDGIVIVGREMVNYTPEDVKYFSNETQLEDYFFNKIQNQ